MSCISSLLRVLAALAAAATVFLFGGYSASRSLWPWPLMRQIRLIVMPSTDPHYDPPHLFTLDNTGRLTGKVGSELVTCPQQDERTAVILILGQSNAGNHSGQKTE